MDRFAAAEKLRRALQMFIATLSEERALEIASVYPAWEPMKSYVIGDIVSYGVNSLGDPQLYKIVQAHTSQSDWTPSTTPSLYDAFGLDASGYPIWAQPSGAHDAYSKGDVVNYNGTIYESVIDGNVWSPDVYPAGWKTVSDGAVSPEPSPDADPGATEYPDWVQPSGAHDAYNTGDIVRYNGVLYRSKIDGNVWSPDAYPAGWEVVPE